MLLDVPQEEPVFKRVHTSPPGNPFLRCPLSPTGTLAHLSEEPIPPCKSPCRSFLQVPLPTCLRCPLSLAGALAHLSCRLSMHLE